MNKGLFNSKSSTDATSLEEQALFKPIIQAKAYIDQIIQDPTILSKKGIVESVMACIETLKQLGFDPKVEGSILKQLFDILLLNQQYIPNGNHNGLLGTQGNEMQQFNEQQYPMNSFDTMPYEQAVGPSTFQHYPSSNTTTPTNSTSVSPTDISSTDNNLLMDQSNPSMISLDPHVFLPASTPTSSTPTTVDEYLHLLNQNIMTPANTIPFRLNENESTPDTIHTLNDGISEMMEDDQLLNDHFSNPLQPIYIPSYQTPKIISGKAQNEIEQLRIAITQQQSIENYRMSDDQRKSRWNDIQALTDFLTKKKKSLSSSDYKNTIATYNEKFTKDLNHALATYMNHKVLNPRKKYVEHEEFSPFLTTFQRQGVSWLTKMHIQKRPMLLADEAGLGKLYQLFAFLILVREQSEKHLGSLMVIKDEVMARKVTHALSNMVEKWTKSLSYLVIYMDDNLNAVSNLEERIERDQIDLVITFPEKLIANKRHGSLRNVEWQMIILDAGEAVTKEKCKLVKLLRSYRAYNRLFLTPNMIQDDTKLIWAVIHFIYPVIFETIPCAKRQFESWFGSPFAPNLKFSLRGTNPNREKRLLNQILFKVIEPCILRRTKEEVRFNLPKEEFHAVTIPMSKIQMYTYGQFLSDLANLGDDRLNEGQWKDQVIDCLKKLNRACVNPMANYENENVYKVFGNKQLYLRQLPVISSKIAWLLGVLPALCQEKKRIAILCHYQNVLNDLSDFLKMTFGVSIFNLKDYEESVKLPPYQCSISLMNTMSLDYHNFSFDVVFALDVSALQFSKQFTTCGGKMKSTITVISVQSATPLETICFETIKNQQMPITVIDKKWKTIRDALMQPNSGADFVGAFSSMFKDGIEPIDNKKYHDFSCLSEPFVANMLSHTQEDKERFEMLLQFSDPSTVFFANAQMFNMNIRALLFDILKIDMNRPLPSFNPPEAKRFVRSREHDEPSLLSGASRRLKLSQDDSSDLLHANLLKSSTDQFVSVSSSLSTSSTTTNNLDKSSLLVHQDHHPKNDEDEEEEELVGHIYPFMFTMKQLNPKQQQLYKLFKQLVTYRDPKTNNFVSAPFWDRHDGLSLRSIEERIGSVSDYSFNILLHDFQELSSKSTKVLRGCADQLVDLLRSMPTSFYDPSPSFIPPLNPASSLSNPLLSMEQQLLLFQNQYNNSQNQI